MENRVAGAQASQASPRSSTRPLNPYDARLERAQMDLIRSLANFHPTRVIGSRADKADCDNAAHDIIEFAGMCDEFVRAYGEYMAAHSVSITPKDITECFASPFRDALDGNATHILRKAGEELAEAGRDVDGARADYRRSFIQAAE
jgi:hypothetical protein